MSLASFLSVAARDIRVGAVMPSSRHAVRQVLAAVPAGASRIIEYGPGDGVITRRLFERLSPDGRLLAIETNERFTAGLSSISEPRFSLVHGDARRAVEHAAALGLGQFDAAVSGIPFSLLSDADRREVVDMTHGLLRSGGAFVVYQTSPLMVPYLRRRFGVSTKLELRNIPPYFIMKAVKE